MQEKLTRALYLRSKAAKRYDTAETGTNQERAAKLSYYYAHFIVEKLNKKQIERDYEK